MLLSDTYLFIFSMIDSAGLIFLVVFFIINLSDLECDYINATVCCDRLNKFIIPEIVAMLCLTAIFFVHFHWIYFLLTLPLSLWLVYRYLNKPAGNMGIYDPAEIHNRSELKGFLKEAMVKLGFHLISFFIYLYSVISVLISKKNKS
ncbi:protein cornichon homolog 4-like [Xenia sp. Carnegie-2017]|uniref:protein cornichon homolog 4-like n=1 Tax=Xenia sp. Carnegie-2017 TaxID=2897299 RepID=UPI001F035B4F|nr:protein cornichon homolog 4-like [Xenia sp. Carnegie-2017]